MARRELKAKTARFFTTEAELDQLYELALLNLPIKAIADNIGCSYQTITTNDFAASIVRQGHSDYLKKLNAEVHKFAFMDLSQYEPKERDGYATLKAKCLGDLYKVANKDPFVPPQELERVKRLTDEELAIEIQRAAEVARNKTVVSGTRPQ